MATLPGYLLKGQNPGFAYAATAVKDGDRRIRYVIKRRADGRPSPVGCLYAAHLSRAYESPNTVETILKGVRALLSFADENGHDIEGILLRGERIEPRKIRAFAYWLEQRYCRDDGVMTTASA